ncbi:hypothetical protein BGW36DRAFT_105910 [Talaromyces proteolyticus]|uniref:Uncharacterized protein n=1 Tax=Talaromyces proteolyticus TaxID=1131652 RepID=A0AAD4L0E5_9EURO|nr:uncharacterized protein BGW36DRAFT_105910 [Talaromyces proteolyticus]KAH8701816.1 hypothetical protein BGW36DRAFT_105910 [Talaromyces proteolyticus]
MLGGASWRLRTTAENVCYLRLLAITQLVLRVLAPHGVWLPHYWPWQARYWYYCTYLPGRADDRPGPLAGLCSHSNHEFLF